MYFYAPAGLGAQPSPMLGANIEIAIERAPSLAMLRADNTMFDVAGRLQMRSARAALAGRPQPLHAQHRAAAKRAQTEMISHMPCRCRRIYERAHARGSHHAPPLWPTCCCSAAATSGTSLAFLAQGRVPVARFHFLLVSGVTIASNARTSRCAAAAGRRTRIDDDDDDA